MYNSLNLNLNAYTHQNPLKYTDPDGRALPAIVVVCAASPACVSLTAVTVAAVANGVRGTMDALSNRNASSRSEPIAVPNTATRTREGNDNYSVRIQVQGKELKFEGHIPINKNSPVTASEAIAALGELQSQLPKSDAKMLGDSFQKAEKWVQNVAKQGGVGPIGSTSFTKVGVRGSEARVDVEILRGPVNLVKE